MTITTIAVLGGSTLLMLLALHVVIPLIAACRQHRKLTRQTTTCSMASKDEDKDMPMPMDSDGRSGSNASSAGEQSTRSSSVLSTLRSALVSSSPSSTYRQNSSVHRYDCLGMIVIGFFDTVCLMCAGWSYGTCLSPNLYSGSPTSRTWRFWHPPSACHRSLACTWYRMTRTWTRRFLLRFVACNCMGYATSACTL